MMRGNWWCGEGICIPPVPCRPSACYTRAYLHLQALRCDPDGQRALKGRIARTNAAKEAEERMQARRAPLDHMHGSSVALGRGAGQRHASCCAAARLTTLSSGATSPARTHIRLGFCLCVLEGAKEGVRVGHA